MFVGRHRALGFIHDKLESPVEVPRVRRESPRCGVGTEKEPVLD